MTGTSVTFHRTFYAALNITLTNNFETNGTPQIMLKD